MGVLSVTSSPWLWNTTPVVGGMWWEVENWFCELLELPPFPAVVGFTFLCWGVWGRRSRFDPVAPLPCQLCLWTVLFSLKVPSHLYPVVPQSGGETGDPFS